MTSKRIAIGFFLMLLAAIVLSVNGARSEPGHSRPAKPKRHATHRTAERVKRVCPDIRKAIRYYRTATWRHQTAMGRPKTRTSYLERKRVSCDFKAWIAITWRERAHDTRKRYERWEREQRRIARRKAEAAHRAAEAAAAAWRLQTSDPIGAIRAVFGSYADQAIAVARCESGYRTDATNGQYYGMFQMGTWERANYALGRYSTPLEQTQAAYRYFVASGRDWSPWECKPW